MKADEKRLERVIKKVLKGEESSAEDLLFHWTGLGITGDQVLIQTLNRLNGWEQFVGWALRQPAVLKQLQTIANAAGITEDAAEHLQKGGIEIAESGTPRVKALEILKTVHAKKLQEARTLLENQGDLLPAIVSMIELEANRDSATFLSTLLALDWNPEHEQILRKALYRLKQKGIQPDSRPATARAISATELFVFGENKIPLWQPVFYFRSHSSFSDTGDLFMLQIFEGKDVEIADQKRNVSVSAGSLKQLANRYAEQLEQQSGLPVKFHFLSVAEARYLLQKSSQLLKEPASKLRMEEFLKFVSTGDVLNPFATSSNENRGGSSDSFLQHPYFAFWLLDVDDLTPYLERTKEIQSGPIILPEQQVKQMIHVAQAEALEAYFNGERRFVWAAAFEKAAFFLKDSEPAISTAALDCSQDFADTEIASKTIPAAITLFQRTLESVERQKKRELEEEKRSSVIMSPQEFEKLHRRR